MIAAVFISLLMFSVIIDQRALEERNHIPTTGVEQAHPPDVQLAALVREDRVEGSEVKT